MTLTRLVPALLGASLTLLASSPATAQDVRWGEMLAAAAPVNLALGKPATQSSDLGDGTGTAAKAVDGNTDGNFFSGSVTHTKQDAQAWWQVDLGSPQAVQSVEVWNRTECCSERLSNFNVLLLDSNQVVVTSAHVEGEAGRPTTVTLSGTGRYLKVQLVGTNYLSLAEVRVFGPGDAGDEFQRTIVFHNDLPFTVWPVFQAPQDANCLNLYSPSLDARPPETPGRGWKLLRIHVNWQDPANSQARDLGIPAGKSVKVTIPKTITGPDSKGATVTCEVGAFYSAARIPVLVAHAKDFEQLLLTQGNGKSNQVTTDGTNTRDGTNWWKRYPHAKLPTQICGGTTPDDDPCWIGWAESAYPLDAPAQLLEYTIVSQNAQGSANANPNDPSGGARSFLDFDVSYVDEVYLPATMAPDTGATPYMGSNLGFTDFQKGLNDFLALDLNPDNPGHKDELIKRWPLWAAFDDLNFTKADSRNKTLFANLLVRNGVGATPRIPSGAQVVEVSRLAGTSLFYKPTRDPNEKPLASTACVDPAGKENLVCKATNAAGMPAGQCCPQVYPDTWPEVEKRGWPEMLGCCDKDKFLIDGLKYVFAPTSQDQLRRKPVGKQLEALTARWTNWQSFQPYKCDVKQPFSPVEDQVRFCNDFQRTAQFVWTEFSTQDTNGAKICSTARDDADRNQCLTSLIVGYQVDQATKQRFDGSCNPPGSKQCVNKVAGKCCPDDCPDFCTKEKVLNESVQALLRGVPWTSSGPATDGPQVDCSQCPNLDVQKCPVKQCVWVDPTKTAANAKLFQYDGFLHYWAPYDSVYNLNPYARLVHAPGTRRWEGTPPEGLDAPGAYAFSIDDFYGNFGGPGSNLIIGLGAPVKGSVRNNTRQPNPEPYDPYLLYAVTLGEGWHHVDICGRTVNIPQKNGTDGGFAFSTPLSFWNSQGERIPEPCVITVTDRTGLFVKYALREAGQNIAQPEKAAYEVEDTYIKAGNGVVNRKQPVRGLSGVAAVRGGGREEPGLIDEFCQRPENHSSVFTPADLQGLCTGNLSTVGRGNRDAFNGVTDDNCPNTPLGRLNATCGRPLVKFNVPARCPKDKSPCP
jgi:F5/8 type C domain